ncbi:MAG TPA: hypothetical protein DEG69_03450 [Flavobacteriaceae bacterium]|nr:hypothetical protein [Flavobacteriaceae bacterium]
MIVKIFGAIKRKKPKLKKMMISGIINMNSKGALAFLLITGFGLQSNYAQSDEVLAKSYFLKAQEAYSEGNNATALKQLDKTLEYLGTTNAKIEALYVKVSINRTNYIVAECHLNTYFEIADESHSDYIQMLGFVAKVKEEKELQVEKKSMPLEKSPASFSGGKVALTEYLSQNLTYPEEAKSLQIEGKVYVTFSISKDGSTENIKAIRGPGFGLNKEAIRLIQNMPNWKPAIQNGKPVGAKMMLPITFKL